MEVKQYVLIDLERSVKSSLIHYWKKNSRGYTMAPGEAGRYDEEQAVDLVAGDINKLTIAVEVNKLSKLLGLN